MQLLSPETFNVSPSFVNSASPDVDVHGSASAGVPDADVPGSAGAGVPESALMLRRDRETSTTTPNADADAATMPDADAESVSTGVLTDTDMLLVPVVEPSTRPDTTTTQPHQPLAPQSLSWPPV